LKLSTKAHLYSSAGTDDDSSTTADVGYGSSHIANTHVRRRFFFAFLEQKKIRELQLKYFQQLNYVYRSDFVIPQKKICTLRSGLAEVRELVFRLPGTDDD
jgi:hypothetical protein